MRRRSLVLALAVVLAATGAAAVPVLAQVSPRRLVSAAASSPTVTLLAENATRSGGVTLAHDHGNVLGAGYATGFSHPGDGLAFTVDSPAAGSAAVAIGYFNGARRTAGTLTLVVNGRAAGQVSFPGRRSWSSPGSVNRTVHLVAGPNTISLEVGSGDRGGVQVNALNLTGLPVTPPTTSTTAAPTTTSTAPPGTETTTTEASTTTTDSGSTTTDQGSTTTSTAVPTTTSTTPSTTTPPTTATTTPAPACASLAKAGGGTWTCTFDDEFTGTAVDPAKWSVISNAKQGWGWGNGCFLDDNQHVKVAAGNLQLVGTTGPSTLCATKLENGSTSTPWQTGAVETRNKFSQRYGRFEMRARLPRGQGMWPAFWMMPQGDAYGAWPNSGEIDILEALGHQPSTAYATLHYINPAGQDPNDSHVCAIAPNWADAFHTYTLEWTPTTLTVLYDGTACHTFTNWSSKLGGSKPFDQPFFIILDLAVGGAWPGNPDTTTPFPATFAVDYIRAWQ